MMRAMKLKLKLPLPQVKRTSRKSPFGRCECSGGYANGGVRGSARCENDVNYIHHLVSPIKPATIPVDELTGLCQVCHETRHEVNSVLEIQPRC